MRHMFAERVRIRIQLATVAAILLHIIVAIFVAISVVQAFQVIADVSHRIANLHDKILAVGLATAFVPFGCIVFWGCKALVIQFHNVFKPVIRLARSSRIKYSVPGTANIHRRSREE
jgi:hypothetical protein